MTTQAKPQVEKKELTQVEEYIEVYEKHNNVMILEGITKRHYPIYDINAFKNYIMTTVKRNNAIIDLVADNEIRYHYSVYDCRHIPEFAGNYVQCVNRFYFISYTFKA